MRLIIGGAFQGKRDYVKDTYGIREEDIVTCTPDRAPGDAACYDRYENYILYCMRQGNRDYCRIPEEKIIIMTDIFCGVVPMDRERRAFREECGRVMTFYAKNAESVERVFAGLSLKLK